MRGLGSGLVFAALAAAASLPLFLLLAPLVGPAGARVLVWSAALAVLAAGLAGGRARGTGAFLALAALGVVLLLAGAREGEIAVALGAALAVCRSGVLFRVRPARAALVEGALGLGALAMAGFLQGPGPLGLALALWGYLLVQAAWFLVPGARRVAEAGEADPFEEAERRVRGLLEGA